MWLWESFGLHLWLLFYFFVWFWSKIQHLSYMNWLLSLSDLIP